MIDPELSGRALLAALIKTMSAVNAVRTYGILLQGSPRQYLPTVAHLDEIRDCIDSLRNHKAYLSLPTLAPSLSVHARILHQEVERICKVVSAETHGLDVGTIKRFIDAATRIINWLREKLKQSQPAIRSGKSLSNSSRPKRKRNRKRRSEPTKEMMRAFDARQRGFTLRDIGKLVKKSPETVRQWCNLVSQSFGKSVRSARAVSLPKDNRGQISIADTRDR